MAQRTQMYYAYFRFYVEESEIITGMNKYCTEWEHMFAIGYNYREYKCFVDDVGGFEHWVGDMRGYISQERETGFIDAAPTDSVYDSTLMMGAQRFITANALMLHAIKYPVKVIIRKIIAQHAAVGTVDITLSSNDKIEHSFYMNYDETKIELYEYGNVIVDDSTADSYSLTFDLPAKKFVVPTIDSSNNVTDPEKSIDGNYNTKAVYQEQRVASWIIYDFGSPMHFFNITGKVWNKSAASNVLWKFQGSDDKISWTDFKTKTIVRGAIKWWDEYVDIDATYRYVRCITEEKTSEDGWLYQLNFGIA